MKKSMLTALIALGFITPIVTNTRASAAEFNQNYRNSRKSNLKSKTATLKLGCLIRLCVSSC